MSWAPSIFTVFEYIILDLDIFFQEQLNHLMSRKNANCVEKISVIHDMDIAKMESCLEN